MNPLLWIPCLILLSTFQCYASTKFNARVPHWGLVLWLSALIPVWLVISRYSKDILLDGLAYDVVVFLTWGIAAGFITGRFQTYSVVQWVGLVLVVTGFLLMHDFK